MLSHNGDKFSADLYVFKFILHPFSKARSDFVLIINYFLRKIDFHRNVARHSLIDTANFHS